MDGLDGKDSIARAREIAETLIPLEQRPHEWAGRWDALEEKLAENLSEKELRDAYLRQSAPSGDAKSDILAAACLVRGIDI